MVDHIPMLNSSHLWVYSRAIAAKGLKLAYGNLVVIIFIIFYNLLSYIICWNY